MGASNYLAPSNTTEKSDGLRSLRLPIALSLERSNLLIFNLMEMALQYSYLLHQWSMLPLLLQHLNSKLIPHISLVGPTELQSTQVRHSFALLLID